MYVGNVNVDLLATINKQLIQKEGCFNMLPAEGVEVLKEKNVSHTVFPNAFENVLQCICDSVFDSSPRL